MTNDQAPMTNSGRAAAFSLVIGICLLVFLFLPGRGERGNHRTTIDFWAMGGEGERIGSMVNAFERDHPDVNVRLQQIPWSAAHEKLLTAFAGDTLPDVCQLGNTWIAEFEALGALEDLTDRVGDGKAVDPANYFPGVWAGNVIADRVYGAPWYVDTRIMFYRKDLLAAAGHDKPPRTWDEWMRVMRDVKANQAGERVEVRLPSGATEGLRTADKYAILLPVNEFEPPIILGYQVGADMLKDDGRYGNFSGAEFRRAFDFYANIFREGLAPKVSNTRISNVWQEFERGTFAMYVTGPWNVVQFRERMSPDMQGKWTTAPMPGPTSQRPGTSTAGGSSLVIFRPSRHKAAAWQFIEFMSRRDQQVELCLCTSNMPAREDAWEGAGLLKDAEYAAFHEQLNNVRPAPPVPEWEQIVTGELVKTAEAVIVSGVDMRRALEDLDRKVDAILEKRRWMLAQADKAAAEQGTP
jgi:multiple sugar transport system substrate-binding protein